MDQNKILKTLRLSPEFHEAVRLKALSEGYKQGKKNGKSFSDWITKVIRKQCDNLIAAEDPNREHGLKRFYQFEIEIEPEIEPEIEVW